MSFFSKLFGKNKKAKTNSAAENVTKEVPKPVAEVPEPVAQAPLSEPVLESPLSSAPGVVSSKKTKVKYPTALELAKKRKEQLKELKELKDKSAERRRKNRELVRKYSRA